MKQSIVNLIYKGEIKMVFELSFSAIEQAKDRMNAHLLGAPVNPVVELGTSFGNDLILILVGLVTSKTKITSFGSYKAILDKTIEFTENVEKYNAQQYLDQYTQWYNVMKAEGSRRIRLDGNFTTNYVYDEYGNANTVYLINGYPNVTGYLTKDGVWITIN